MNGALNNLSGLKDRLAQSWHSGETPGADADAAKVAGLGELRRQAWDDFERRGFPTRKDEAWHYTDARPWYATDLEWSGGEAAATAQDPAPALNLADPFQICFHNGRLVPGRTRAPRGIEVSSLAESCRRGSIAGLPAAEFTSALKEEADRASLEHGAFTDLNLALLEEGAVISVPAGFECARPLHVIMSWDSGRRPAIGGLVNWVRLGPGAKLTLAEWNLGGAAQRGQFWTRAHLAEGAKLIFSRAQAADAGAAMVGLLTVDQRKSSEFYGALLLHGGGLARETWLIDQEEPGATTKLSALVIGEKQDHMDLCSVITHQAGAGVSEQRFRALLGGPARGVFNGKIGIARDAQLVSAAQLSQALLLSDKAEINAKPELEIYADNVKAAHGASVGQLDPEQIYYLQSRGLKRELAERLVAQGFARAAAQFLPDAELRDQLLAWIDRQVAAITGGAGAIAPEGRA
jgi:Fe-S cluster assembly protein SufD